MTAHSVLHAPHEMAGPAAHTVPTLHFTPLRLQRAYPTATSRWQSSLSSCAIHTFT